MSCLEPRDETWHGYWSLSTASEEDTLITVCDQEVETNQSGYGHHLKREKNDPQWAHTSKVVGIMTKKDTTRAWLLGRRRKMKQSLMRVKKMGEEKTGVWCLESEEQDNVPQREEKGEKQQPGPLLCSREWDLPQWLPPKHFIIYFPPICWL